MRICEVPIGAKFRVTVYGAPSTSAYIRIADRLFDGQIYNAIYAATAKTPKGTRTLNTTIGADENCVVCE